MVLLLMLNMKENLIMPQLQSMDPNITQRQSTNLYLIILLLTMDNPLHVKFFDTNKKDRGIILDLTIIHAEKNSL